MLNDSKQFLNVYDKRTRNIYEVHSSKLEAHPREWSSKCRIDLGPNEIPDASSTEAALNVQIYALARTPLTENSLLTLRKAKIQLHGNANLFRLP